MPPSVLPLTVRPVEGQLMSLEEYLTFEKDCPEYVEYYSGRLHLCAAPNNEHQSSAGDIFGEMWLLSRKVGGKCYFAPYLVELPAGDRLQPDLLYLTPDQLSGIRNDGFHGSPALVMEILSESSQKYDQGYKFFAFEKAGVREYWIIDPLLHTIRLFHLKDGKFLETPPGPEGHASAVLPGLVLDPRKVFGV